MPAPVMPPPTTSRSSSRAASARTMVARVAGESGAATDALRSVRGAELGEHRLRLGYLVGATELLRDLERAPRVLDAFVLLAAILADAREADARVHGGGIERDHLVQHGLALVDVASEEAREADEERALRRQRARVVGLELDGTVELADQPTQADDVLQRLAVEPHPLALVAEEREVGV